MEVTKKEFSALVIGCIRFWTGEIEGLGLC